MEINFKKVHTGKDLAISAIVIIAGIALFFVSKGLGICIAACGLLMLLCCKGGYKKDGQGAVLTKKSEDLCKACKVPLADFLNGKDCNPSIKKGSEGGSVRLDVYYNKAEGIGYAQLFDFCNYAYEPLTGVVELNGDNMNRIISQL
ncbi:MAG: hypothetical protein Q4G10_02900 [Bacteroidia bacterium]|nr:hypothetical protein [Bacteroidia bacterium]